MFGCTAMPIRKVDSTPLSQTRQVTERFREIWLTSIAKHSRENRWDKADIIQATLTGALEAALAGNIRTKAAADELARQGRLAAHPDVRFEFDRLVALRNEVWLRDRTLLKCFHHGPSQILVDLMTRQRDLADRQHVSSADSYLRFLRSRNAPHHKYSTTTSSNQTAAAVSG